MTCNWCEKFEGHSDGLCSWCHEAKLNGKTHRDLESIILAKRHELENKQKSLEEDLEKKLGNSIVSERLFKMCLKITTSSRNSITPEKLHRLLYDILSHNKAFLSWKQALTLYNCLHLAKYCDDMKNKLQHVLCSKVIDYWNIDVKLMPTGNCYYSFVIGKPKHLNDFKIPNLKMDENAGF